MQKCTPIFLKSITRIKQGSDVYHREYIEGECVVRAEIDLFILIGCAVK
jgi:hypothetical protein